MASIEIVDQTRKAVGSVEVNEAVFGSQPHGSLVHSAVVMQLASLRQGTASSKGRSEVSGTGKKPWRQKHTGRARAGSNRSPVWRHGGTVFGPQPRKYRSAMSKKMYRKAMQSALSAKMAAGELLVLSELALPEPKTKLMAKTVKQLGATGPVLFVVGKDSDAVFRAARNLAQVKAVSPDELTVYDVLRYRTLVVLKDELPGVEELWA
ncbi:MAG: 50S ribosomal protein L4 [Nitrospira sp.]|nr:50S ribosomal protein L4 [Nitrospira sp.]